MNTTKERVIVAKASSKARAPVCVKPNKLPPKPCIESVQKSGYYQLERKIATNGTSQSDDLR